MDFTCAEKESIKILRPIIFLFDQFFKLQILPLRNDLCTILLHRSIVKKSPSFAAPDPYPWEFKSGIASPKKHLLKPMLYTLSSKRGR